MKRLIAGNWKMNGLRQSRAEFLLLKRKLQPQDTDLNDILVCPPSTLLMHLTEDAQGSPIKLGGQDCHHKESGAHTGDISAEMLADAGASMCIIGHSERRRDHGESNEAVRAKAEALHRAGLTAVICVGETRYEREAGNAVSVVKSQVHGSMPSTTGGVVVSYEPVWAIGTGLIPALEDIEEMHEVLRDQLGPQVRLLYGGSVKASNAKDILSIPDVNGALVGGASLTAEDFYGIISA